MATVLPSATYSGSHITPISLDVVPVPNPAAPSGKDSTST